MVALVLGVLGLLFSLFNSCMVLIAYKAAKRNRQADKDEAEQNRQAASKKEVTRSWQLSVQPALGRLHEYKQETGADGVDYARKFMGEGCLCARLAKQNQQFASDIF